MAVHRKSSGKAKGIARALARPGDPYVTGTGQIIHPEGAKVDVESDEFKLNASNFKSTKRRSIKELPADVATMKAVACVFTLAMMGLGRREIAEALKIDAEQIDKVQQHKAYTEVFDAIAGEFINSSSAHMGARLAGYSHAALTSIADIAFNGNKEENRLRGSMDIMDRGGHSPRQRAEMATMDTNELRIVVINEGEGKVDVRIGGEAF